MSFALRFILVPTSVPLVTVLKERNLLTQFGNAKRLDLSVSTAIFKSVQTKLHVCGTRRDVKRDIYRRRS